MCIRDSSRTRSCGRTAGPSGPSCPGWRSAATCSPLRWARVSSCPGSDAAAPGRPARRPGTRGPRPRAHRPCRRQVLCRETGRMQDHGSLVAVLNSTWFASGLEPGVQTRLAELSRTFTAEPGQELFREGDESEVFGVVIKGRIALRTHVPERGDFTILTVEPGDVYGWSALVPPYRATCLLYTSPSQ